MMSAGIRSGVNWMRENVSVERLGQRAHEHRLAEAGHALEQRVTAGEQGGGDRAVDVGLPDHPARDLDEQPVDVRAECRDRSGGDLAGRHAIGGRHLPAFCTLPARGRIRSK